MAPITIGHSSNHGRVISDDGFYLHFIPDPAIGEQPNIGRAALHQQLEYLLVSKLFGDIMRGDMPTERPLENGTAAPRVGFWEKFLVHPHTNAFWISVQVVADKTCITESRCHQ